MKPWKKLLLAIAITPIALILLLSALVYALWNDEISTISSITLVRERDDAHHDGAVYTMSVNGDFYLDDFVAQGGAKNDS